MNKKQTKHKKSTSIHSSKKKVVDSYNSFKEEMDRHRATNQADRYNDGKRQWGLVHYKSLEPMVEVLEFGSKKYAPDNWKKGLDKREILESMMRHLTALMDGQHDDPESGITHMGHIQCNAMFYNYFDKHE
jgi:dATP/dGTP diphosphohydrolase